MTRPTKYEPEFCERIVEHMKGGASMTSFAAEIGVCRATINNWGAEHPEFLEAIGRGKAACARWWEELAREGADGTRKVHPSLVMFGLKNMAAEDWREKQEVEHIRPEGRWINLDDYRSADEMPSEVLVAIAQGAGEETVANLMGEQQ